MSYEFQILNLLISKYLNFYKNKINEKIKNSYRCRAGR